MASLHKSHAKEFVAELQFLRHFELPFQTPRRGRYMLKETRVFSRHWRQNCPYGTSQFHYQVDQPSDEVPAHAEQLNYPYERNSGLPAPPARADTPCPPLSVAAVHPEEGQPKLLHQQNQRHGQEPFPKP